MFAVDGLILSAALLLIFAIASGKFSARLGVPVLVGFLVLGMVAGSEGLGRIEFDNYPLAHGIGTVALVLILFDGGLRTPLSSFRAAYKPALVLATLGVAATAALTGLAATWIFDLSLTEGALLGSIVGSTDAAAVFAALRGQGLSLSKRLAATLEVESASNDPMAIFLTVGLIEILLGRMEPSLEFVLFFITQMSVGAVVGWLVGRGAVELNNRVNLASAGLYPLLIVACGFLAYGIAAALRGSGFLAVYLAGIVVGNHRIVFQRGIYLFSDGMAWLGQIVMFIILGLVSFPSRLVEIAPEGLLLAGVLVFISRPAVVFATMFPFGFNWRELTFISWAGLKGAVPIVLATYPLLFGVPSGGLFFDIIFFTVLVSVVAQGWTLPRLATALDLQVPGEPEAPVTLEITSLHDVNGDIVEYMVGPSSRAVGRLIRELALPEGAVVAMITRNQEIIPPRGSTKVLEGDHVFLVLRSGVRPLVDRAFSRDARTHPDPLPAAEFPLFASTTVGELEEFYGIEVQAPPEQTLATLLEKRLERSARVVGARAYVGGVWLTIREVAGDEIVLVGLALPAIEGSEVQ